MSKILTRIKVLFVMLAVCVLGLVGGIFSLNTDTQASAEEPITVTQIQFRTNAGECFFFLRMQGQTDYVTGNENHDASFVTETNLLDKVTIYFLNSAATLREVWTGEEVTTYKWGDDHTLTFKMKAQYLSSEGRGARIDAGAEIPMISGTKKVTAVSRTFWDYDLSETNPIESYVEGYNPIESSLVKVHIRSNENEDKKFLLIGLGAGNDWDGKGEALPTEVKGSNGSNDYALVNWQKLYLSTFTSKIKLHVKETNTWVTLGSILNPNPAPQWVMIYNGWGESGGVIRVNIQNAYNGTTIDQILFEKGCELPTYQFLGGNVAHAVHVLDKNYLCTSLDMTQAHWAVDWKMEEKYSVRYNNGSESFVDGNVPLAYPTDLSESKPATAEYTYVYNWYHNGKLYDFSKPVTENLHLISDGTFTEIANPYKVTYYALDGATVKYEDTVRYGEELVLRTDVTQPGYENPVWIYNGEGAVPTTMPAKDISFTLTGTPKTYTLAFEGLADTLSVTYDAAIGTLPAVPEKVGHSGVWTVNGEEITADTVWNVDGEATAKAVYTANQYTLSFEGLEETVSVTYGAAIGAIPTAPAKPHYTGVWTLDGETIDADTVWAVGSDKEAKVGYIPVNYTVTMGEEEFLVAYGAKVAKPADPTKEATTECEYVFDGWYNGETKWDFETDVVEGDTVLVAKFTKKMKSYTISFNVTGNDAIQLEPITVEYGTRYDLTKLLDGEDVSGYTYSISIKGVEKVSVKVVADVTVDVTFTPAVYAPTDDSDGKGGLLAGCSGTVGGISMALVALTAAGLAFVAKKKED